MNGEHPLLSLPRPLTEAHRHALRRTLSGLLAFQSRLDRFPRLGPAPNASAVVSLYAAGRLRGCAWTNDDEPRRRVARAFLSALADVRFGGIPESERASVTAQVSFPTAIRRVSFDAAPRLIAPGCHGVALATAGQVPVLLVPEVAREHELDANGLLAALEQKSGVPSGAWPHGGLFLFETERVVARSVGFREGSVDPTEAAVRFLAARVQSDGHVTFGFDPRGDSDVLLGPMHHGRAAVVLKALSAHPAGRPAARRAKTWLDRQIRDALAGRRVDGWPAERAAVAGTLALAKMAGIDVGRPLRGLAGDSDVHAAPWHAAQLAAALGRDAPAPLWGACVQSLDADPRAPWVAIAAAAREDWAVYERVAVALAASVREHGPHRGGVGSDSIPELALTAVTVEALAPARDAAIQRAARLARAFIERNQVAGDILPESVDPGRVHGGLPLTPVHLFMRSDVTAHAVLALASTPEP
jgi:AMMECR1 domain-containing protein